MSMYRWIMSAALVALAAVAFAAPAGLDQNGKPDLKSAGALTFGPKGVLFVGDPQGAQVVAIDVGTAPTNPISSGFKLDGADASAPKENRATSQPRIRQEHPPPPPSPPPT